MSKKVCNETYLFITLTSEKLKKIRNILTGDMDRCKEPKEFQILTSKREGMDIALEVIASIKTQIEER